MARRRKNRDSNIQKSARRDYLNELDRIIRSSPVIRVVDRKARFEDRRRQHVVALRRKNKLESIRTLAPQRYARKFRNELLERMFPDAYYKFHDCRREWRKLLSWRKDQKGSGGGKARSPRELRESKQSFRKRDC